MHVEILTGAETGTVELVVHERPDNLPEWIQLSPGKADPNTILTRPASHFFNRNSGKLGVPRNLIATAGEFLSGVLDAQAASDTFTRELEAWSQVEAQTEGNASAFPGEPKPQDASQQAPLPGDPFGGGEGMR